jgi:UDP-N-acetylglucosamine 2-epimerase
MKKRRIKMIKVMSIFGTRPEAIKMAPLVKELEKRKNIESIVCVTAQHREMLDQVLETFDIKPDYDLNIMKQGQTLADVTTRALTGLEEVIKEARPDIVLVHGDTTTTFAGALAAFYNQVAIGHVEAGLRTDNKYSPYPEEMNRQMVDRLSDMYFAPTEISKNNLLKENINESKIYITGNTAIDAMSTTVDKNYTHKELEWIKPGERMILLTAHRRENLGEPMRHIFKAIKRIVDEFDDVKVIYPIHMNPKVREVANEVFDGDDKVKLIEPLEVFDFHNFQNKSYIILTDSGGIQEEAPSLGKPVLVLRDTTERPEGISAGTLKLVGTDEDIIYEETKRLLTDSKEYERMSKASNPYGDGHASERIVDAIVEYFNKQ